MSQFYQQHNGEWLRYFSAAGIARSRRLPAGWSKPIRLLSPSDNAWDDHDLQIGCAFEYAGRFELFYSATRRHELGLIQRIGRAVGDGQYFSRIGDGLVLELPQHGGHYDGLDVDSGQIQWLAHPWVEATGSGWHMLFAARSEGQGCIGQAVSEDLTNWTLLAPLVRLNQGQPMAPHRVRGRCFFEWGGIVHYQSGNQVLSTGKSGRAIDTSQGICVMGDRGISAPLTLVD